MGAEKVLHCGFPPGGLLLSPLKLPVLLRWSCPRPLDQVVLIHSWLSVCANTSRGEEQERKYATVRIQGLGPVLHREEVLLMALGDRGVVSKDTLYNSFGLAACTGDGCASRFRSCTS